MPGAGRIPKRFTVLRHYLLFPLRSLVLAFHPSEEEMGEERAELKRAMMRKEVLGSGDGPVLSLLTQ